MECSHMSFFTGSGLPGRNACFVKLYDCGIKKRNKLRLYTFDPVGFIIFSAENWFYFLKEVYLLVDFLFLCT